MITLGNLFYSVLGCFTVFVLSSCINSTVSENRDYVLSITLNDSLTIDSVVVERKIEDTTDTLRFYTKDLQIQNNAISISFDLQGKSGSSVSIAYKGFAHQVPVVEKSRTFTISGDGGVTGENIRAVVIPTLISYEAFAQLTAPVTPEDSLHNSELFDSLFVDAILIPGTLTAKLFFDTYMFVPLADSTLIITALVDSLTGRGDQFPYLTLSDKITLDRDVLRSIVNNYRVAHPQNPFDVVIPPTDTLLPLSSSAGLLYSSTITLSSQHTVSSVKSVPQSSIRMVSSSSTSTAAVTPSSGTTTPNAGVSSSSTLLSSASVSKDHTKRITLSGTIATRGELVESITLEVTGDSIETVLSKPAEYDSTTHTYTNFFDLDSTGSQFHVVVKVLNAAAGLTGVAQHDFSLLSQNVVIGAIDGLNALPGLTIDPVSSVSVHDQISISFTATDSVWGTVTSIELKQEGGDFQTITGSPAQITAPSSEDLSYWVVLQVTDSDGNRALDSIALSVEQDAPTVTITGYSQPTNKKDSLLFTWSGSDTYGTIVEYAFKELQESAWVQLGTATSRRLNNPGLKGNYSYVVRATDDDANVAYDTTVVIVANQIPTADNQVFQLDEEVTDLLGSIGATDTDGDALMYRILSGDIGYFTVGNSTGIIEVSSPLDYEVKGTYSILVGVSDGEDSTTVTIDVVVRALNDHLPVIGGGDEVNVTLEEDESQQGITLTATDDDRDGAALQWAIVSQSNSSIIFAAINAQSGLLSITPEENQYGISTVLVSVSDGVHRDTIQYNLDVTSVDDPTVFSGTVSMSAGHAEDSTATVSLTGSCSDVDDATTVSYQWYRDTNSSGLDGVALTDETDPSYVETFQDATSFLYVVVTCTGSESVVRSAYTSLVYYKNRKLTDWLKDARDNNEYDIVYVGAQIWMAQNLRYEESFSKCSNDYIGNCHLYGRVYTWDQVLDTSSASNSVPSGSRGICPENWHVPSRTEFAMLNSYASNHHSRRPVDNLLKSKSGWQAFAGSDSLGFSSMGHGYITSTGDIRDFRASGSYWTTSEYTSGSSAAYMAGFSYNSQTMHYSAASKTNYHGVRCIRD